MKLFTSEWDRDRALKERKEKTRDGRLVINLKESVLDGRKVLTGLVVRTKPPYKKDENVRTDFCVFWLGGLGRDGHSDLFNFDKTTE